MVASLRWHGDQSKLASTWISLIPALLRLLGQRTMGAALQNTRDSTARTQYGFVGTEMKGGIDDVSGDS
jgi:hypothetical protein